MFFAPHLEYQSDEEAEAEVAETRAEAASKKEKEAVPAPAPEAAAEPEAAPASAPEPEPEAAPAPAADAAPAPRAPTQGLYEEDKALEERKKATRLVGCVEKIQVELEAGSKPGDTEELTLPDGRVVSFVVPEGSSPGQVIEIEIGRTTYDAKNPAPVPPVSVATRPSGLSREQLAAFFRKGIDTMEDEGTFAALVGPAAMLRPGKALIEIQQVEFDRMGINRRVGCVAASRIAEDFAADAELLELQATFMRTAQETYIKALEALKPSKLQRSGQIPRDMVLEFFDACNTSMQLPATKARLADYFKVHDKMPNELIITIQKDMLETLGFEREWACSRLNRLSTDFPNDPELGRAMQVWAMTAQAACKQAVAENAPSLRPDSDEMQAMATIQATARDELEKMTPMERTNFLAKMQKRVTVFQKLNPADRMKYVQKLPEREKIDFVKAQILLMSQMQGMQGQMQNMAV